MSRRAAAGLGAAALAVLLTCRASRSPDPGGDGGPGGDGNQVPDLGQADETGSDLVGDGPGDGLPGECDPVAQDCGAGKKCDFRCASGARFVCLADSGGGAHGAACGTGIGVCRKGAICLMNGGDAAGSRCRAYCATDTDCPIGSTCAGINLVCPATDAGELPKVHTRLCTL